MDLHEIRAVLIEAVNVFEPKSEVSDPRWQWLEGDTATDSEKSEAANGVTKVTPLFKD